MSSSEESTGALLRSLRLDKGKSIAEAAALMGVNEWVLRGAERDESVPQPRHAVKIAEFYGRRPSDLWPSAQREEQQ